MAKQTQRQRQAAHRKRAKAERNSAKTFKKRGEKRIADGLVHIPASFNNTLISITDTQGNVVAQSSSGARGFGLAKGYALRGPAGGRRGARKAAEAGMR